MSFHKELAFTQDFNLSSSCQGLLHMKVQVFTVLDKLGRGLLVSQS